jgi:hypothetical protein
MRLPLLAASLWLGLLAAVCASGARAQTMVAAGGVLAPPAAPTALDFVGRTQNSSGNPNSTSPSITISPPAGTQPGDLMLVFIASYNFMPTAQAGWNSAGSTTSANNDDGIVFWRVYQSGDPASFTFSNVNYPKVIMRVYRGVKAVDGVAFASSSATGTSFAVPALAATQAAGESYVAFFANEGSSAVNPGDLIDGTSDPTQWGSFDGDKMIPAKGAGPASETATSSTTAYWVGAAVTLTTVTVASNGTGPCDKAAQNGTSCAVAYSLMRPLFSSYSGPLFQVQRVSDNATHDIGIVGGAWDQGTFNSFCSGTTCNAVKVYDQAACGGTHLDATNATSDGSMPLTPPPIDTFQPTSGVTAPYFGFGYLSAGSRANNSNSNGCMPTGASAITVVMVTNGNIITPSGTCCYEFGDTENTVADDGPSTNFDVWPTVSGYRTDIDLEDGGILMTTPGQATNILTSVIESDGTSNITAEYALTGGSLGYATADTSREQNCSYSAVNNVPLNCWQATQGGSPGTKYGPLSLKGGIGFVIGGDGSGWGTTSPSGGATAGAMIEGIVLSGQASQATLNAIQSTINSAF